MIKKILIITFFFLILFSFFPCCSNEKTGETPITGETSEKPIGTPDQSVEKPNEIDEGSQTSDQSDNKITEDDQTSYQKDDNISDEGSWEGLEMEVELKNFVADWKFSRTKSDVTKLKEVLEEDEFLYYTEMILKVRDDNSVELVFKKYKNEKKETEEGKINGRIEKKDNYFSIKFDSGGIWKLLPTENSIRDEKFLWIPTGKKEIAEFKISNDFLKKKGIENVILVR